MAKKLDPIIIDILNKYEIDPKDALWDCHGSWVMLHKYVEVCGAKAGVTFERPDIIEGSAKEGIVSLLAVGSLGERTEWSVGECSPKNNKNAYPYAMAEKRAKDRVILKLIGLGTMVYSEEEADDFKKRPAPEQPPEQPKAMSRNTYTVLSELMHIEFGENKRNEKTKGMMREWAKENNATIQSLPEDWLQNFRGEYRELESKLPNSL